MRGLHRVGVGDVAAVEEDRPADRVDQPADRLEQRRLAGAVGAEQRDDLALADLDVDAEQHLHPVVRHVEPAHGQQRAVARARAAAVELGRRRERRQRLLGVTADGRRPRS